MEELDKKIEAILFFKGEETLKNLALELKVDIDDIENGLEVLSQKLTSRGIVLVRNGEKVQLRTHPEMSTLIEEIRKEELTRDLGKAGAETLSIILYKGPVTRAEIDYIRGVNSTFIIRNLLIRGLIDKVLNPKDQRSYLYKPTLELLSYLGVTKIEDLPEYSTVKQELEKFMEDKEEDE